MVPTNLKQSNNELYCYDKWLVIVWNGFFGMLRNGKNDRFKNLFCGYFHGKQYTNSYFTTYLVLIWPILVSHPGVYQIGVFFLKLCFFYDDSPLVLHPSNSTLRHTILGCWLTGITRILSVTIPPPSRSNSTLLNVSLFAGASLTTLTQPPSCCHTSTLTCSANSTPWPLAYLPWVITPVILVSVLKSIWIHSFWLSSDMRLAGHQAPPPLSVPSLPFSAPTLAGEKLELAVSWLSLIAPLLNPRGALHATLPPEKIKLLYRTDMLKVLELQKGTFSYTSNDWVQHLKITPFNCELIYIDTKK